MLRRAATVGLMSAGALLSAATLAPAAAQTFYVYTTNEPGKVDGIDTSTATGTPLLPVVPSPTTKLMDLATQQLPFNPLNPTGPSEQLWGIRNTAGSNPAAIYTITAGVSAQQGLLSGAAALTVNGQGPNALVIDPTSGIMYTAASQTSFIYSVCYIAGSCGANPVGFATQLGTAGYGTSFTVQSTNASITGATVTSAGDLEFLDGVLYATLFVSTGGGPSNNQTYLATIDLTPGTNLGKATLLGRTNDGTDNIKIDGLALGFDGTLWGTNASDVYTINTTTGALTLKYTISGLGSVGATGFAVPEPATLGLLGTGLAGLWVARRRKRRAA